jgi:tRNA(fMet)-specific endonuclease VapC
MIVLDTDHLSALRFTEHPRAIALTDRLRTSTEGPVGATVISVEEQTRGWLAEISRARNPAQQVHPYEELAKLAEFFREWRIVRFDVRAAEEFTRLRKQHRRLGASDLKIAAIAVVNNALLLTANLRDFRQVPGLRVENWLAPAEPSASPADLALEDAPQTAPGDESADSV